MKNRHLERLRRRMKQYHRSHPWRLGDNGLMIPHCYEEAKALSWWDDVGFILNKRRVMVWWVHPRMKYRDAIEQNAFVEAGEPPEYDFFGMAKKNWKRIGRSRKKVLSYELPPSPGIVQDYYAKVEDISERMESDGIDLLVRPSISMKTLYWCTGIELCAPVDVRNREEVIALALLARRLIKGETTLAKEFPGYRYGRSEWLAEAVLRSRDRQKRNEGC